MRSGTAVFKLRIRGCNGKSRIVYDSVLFFFRCRDVEIIDPSSSEREKEDSPLSTVVVRLPHSYHDEVV
jgi:hypothetical protein